MDVYIGIDGGGTKTAFVAYDYDFNLLATATLGTCHVLQTDDQQAITILKQGVDSVLENICNIDKVYIGVGLAGYGNNQQLRNKIEYRCQQAFGNYAYTIANDAQIGLAGALNGEDGIFVIAGTGSMALSLCDGEYERCGGWGAAIGDEASAYWIAKRLLQVFTMQADGRLPKTSIYHNVRNACSLTNDYDLISYVNTTLNGQRDLIAQLAPIVAQCVNENDEYAKEIFKEVASDLTMMINTLGKKFTNDVNISYTGGVFNSLQLFAPYLQLSSHIHLCEPKHNPSYGAMLLSRKLKG